MQREKGPNVHHSSTVSAGSSWLIRTKGTSSGWTWTGKGMQCYGPRPQRLRGGVYLVEGVHGEQNHPGNVQRLDDLIGYCGFPRCASATETCSRRHRVKVGGGRREKPSVCVGRGQRLPVRSERIVSSAADLNTVTLRPQRDPVETGSGRI